MCRTGVAKTKVGHRGSYQEPTDGLLLLLLLLTAILGGANGYD